ncbi:disease resistance protein RGA2-like [Humulus lupulus]|uniref:disease resistance protein RGA2-like n=1 Tax=Humulus lupulus TaxID=3486 RepID=UPI002B40CE53|nr:disease resistance protein RGA2-like [Humulus lupulus]
MHDLMHDVAVLVAGSDSVIINQNTKISNGKHLHMSLADFDFDLETHKSSEILEFFSQQKRLRTFLLHNCRYLGFSKLEDYLSKFKCVRALSLSRMDIEVLPKNLCELEHLRYLNLSYDSELKTLPSSLVRLQNLQTLNLVGCENLVRLPRNMKKLVNLRHLIIEGCSSLTEMPPEFGYMTSLHTLDRFVASESSGFPEVSNLINNLQGGLRIERLRHTNYVASKSTAPTLKRVICEGKHNLQLLILKWEEVDDGNNMMENEEMALEGLQPPSSVKELQNCQYLPKLDQLRSLKELNINSVEAAYMCSSAEDEYFDDAHLFFPSLVSLCIEKCPNLKWWWWKRGSDGNGIRSFPRLSDLNIWKCPNLTSMPLFPCIETLDLTASSSKSFQETWIMMRGKNTQANISFLKSITIKECRDLTTLPEGRENLPSLESITIYSCPNLTSLLEGVGNLPSLKSVYIYGCPKLISLLKGIGNLPSLESVTIDNCPVTSLLPGIGNLPSLQDFRIRHCSNLTAALEGIEEIGNLPSLETTNICNCPNLISLPRNLSNFKKYHIMYCPKLEQRCYN